MAVDTRTAAAEEPRLGEAAREPRCAASSMARLDSPTRHLFLASDEATLHRVAFRWMD